MRRHQPPLSGNGTSDRFKKRLSAYSRYAALVQAQFLALQEEDLERYSDLARTRQVIQDGLDREPQDDIHPEPLDPEGQELLNETRAELGEALVLDREIQAILVRLRGQIGGQIKALSRREGKVREYITSADAALGQRSHKLNVRL